MFDDNYFNFKVQTPFDGTSDNVLRYDVVGRETEDIYQIINVWKRNNELHVVQRGKHFFFCFY